jgi:hypothetical protein
MLDNERATNRQKTFDASFDMNSPFVSDELPATECPRLVLLADPELIYQQFRNRGPLNPTADNSTREFEAPMHNSGNRLFYLAGMMLTN